MGMKTTVDISDNLFREAKKLAAEDGTSFKVLVECALRRMLDDGKHEGDWSEIRRTYL